MRAAPPDLDPVLFAEALYDGWSLRVAELEYVPEGGGSHHWTASDAAGLRRFVTVDDLDDKDWLGDTRDGVFAGLDQALRTAVALREVAGLEFVVAPDRGPDGRPVRRLADRYAVSVYPRLPGHSFPYGPFPDAQVRSRALEMITALHRATPVVRAGARVSRPGFGGRHDLEAFLLDAAPAWRGGPFSASARGLFGSRARQLQALVARFDRLVDRTAATHADPVITHGEPHPGNLMSVDERLVLIDWDTAALAAPERDLWRFAAEAGDDIGRYEQRTGRRVDPAALTLYELRWYLDDLASAVRMFHRPHCDSADTRRWFAAIPALLERLPPWLERLQPS